MSLTEAVDQVAALLDDIVLEDGHPLRVVKLLAEVQPPCAWVALSQYDPSAFGAAESTVHVFLVGNDGDEYRALETLSPILASVLKRLSPTAPIEVVGVSPTNQRRTLPALRLTTTTV